MFDERKSTAVLWDVENVSLEHAAIILNKIEEEAKISHAIAFADWRKYGKNNENIKLLIKYNFELIHVPHIDGLKNSADISMVTRGLNLLYHYPNIENFMLLTGDADFRSLLVELRKMGKSISIICDSHNASLDFVGMADKFIDYSSIIFENIPEENEIQEENALSPETFFELLEVTVADLIKKDNSKTVYSGQVKTKMKLFNPAFDEKSIGFSSWKNFIKEAQKHTKVRYFEADNSKLTLEGTGNLKLPKAIKKLCEVLKKMESSPKKSKEKYIDFSLVAKEINAKSYGYSQFKKLAFEAQMRDLIEIKQIGKIWGMKLKK